MAKTLSNSGIINGQIIYDYQVSQSVDAFTGADDYDITISGSLTITGSVYTNGTPTAAGPGFDLVVRDQASGKLFITLSASCSDFY